MTTTFSGPSVSLGTDTTSIHTRRALKDEITRAENQAEATRRRYGLRRTVQGLLFQRDRDGTDGQHRTCFCGRGVRSGQAAVSVMVTNGGKARYKGLTSCGDVWACPSCAAKIAGERRKELERAMVAAHLKGLQGYLLTLTFPHDFGMALAGLGEAFAKALQGFQNSRAFKGFVARHGSIGRVKGLEVKHGANGWHPHVHVLVFARPGLLEDVRGLDALRAEWVKHLLKRGLGAPEQRSDMIAHALDLRGGDDAAAYIAKYGHDERWGLSSEMTSGLHKVGTDAQGHHTPFQLAALAGQGEAWAGALFREYVQAMKGRRALTWTKGLRRALLDSEDEATDEALAALDEPAPEEHHVGYIGLERFQEILARRLEGDLLYSIATWHGIPSQADLDELVDGMISAHPRRASGFLAQVGAGVRRLVGMVGQYA
jgi:hypothetical protein